MQPSPFDTKVCELIIHVHNSESLGAEDEDTSDKLYHLATSHTESCGPSPSSLEQLAHIFSAWREDVQKSMNLLKVAIERGARATAYVTLAEHLEVGDGTERDARQAERLYQRAIALFDDGQAMNNLGCLYCWGLDEVREQKEYAIDLWERSVLKGNLHAMRNLAFALETGDGIAMDRNRAVALYEQLKDMEGFEGCRFNLAWLLSGHIAEVEKNVERAVSLYEAVISEEGDSNAMFNLACLLAEENADYERARFYYEKAVAEGHVGAMQNLGIMLSFGKGKVKPDADVARCLLEKAVECGKREAMFDLGLLEASEGRVSEAMRWYQGVVDEVSHMGAMINMAEVLSEGRGVDKDLKQAVVLSERAIRMGIGEEELSELGIRGEWDVSGCNMEIMREHAVSQGWYLVAMCNLAEILLDGGVGRDIERAIKLLERAVQDEKFSMVVQTQGLEFSELMNIVWKVGKEDDWHIAKKIYTLLAEKADLVKAKRLLGKVYQDVDGDLEKSIQWYHKAIESGCEDSMLQMAELLIAGKGNKDEAMLFLIKILRQGNIEGTVYKEALIKLAQVMLEVKMLRCCHAGEDMTNTAHTAEELTKL